MAERAVSWPGFVNARTLAGIPVDGGVIKADALFRSERAGLEIGGTDGTNRALMAAGISRIIDLRLGDEGATDLVTLRYPGCVNLPITSDDGALEIGLPESQGLMYATMLDACRASLIAVLRAIIAAPPGGVLFHCTAGKDRTGLIAMLVLGALGASDDDIVDDYALTRANLAPFHDAWVASITDPEFKQYLLTHDTNAPREAMVEALAHLRQTYGGVLLYLKDGGFGSDDVDALRARLVDGVRVRSGAFVRRGGQLALIGRRRAGEVYATTPGGGIEPGETAREACIREVQEELGITCMPGETAVLRLEYPGSVQLFFEATTADVELRLGGPEAARQQPDNSHEPRWFTAAEVQGVRPAEVQHYLDARLPRWNEAVQIRPIATDAELDLTFDIIGAAQYPHMARDDWRFGLVREALPASRGYNMVALAGEQIIGGAVCRVLDDGVRVAVLGVDQRYQRRGVGAQLLHAICERATDLGQTRVYLGSVPESTEFYARQGFTVAGTFGATTVFEKEIVIGSA